MIKLRVIFTEAVQDGENHFSQKWWTTDIPVPISIQHEFERFGKCVAGVEVVKECNWKQGGEFLPMKSMPRMKEKKGGAK